jgi:polysaccharide pyruvyl transferase WcaK-like protein
MSFPSLASIRTELQALSTRRRLALYIGWTGHGNLGDEAVRQAIGKLFENRLFLYDKTYIGKGLAFRAGREGLFDCAILGGGTLINLYNSKGYLLRLRQANANKRIIFGAGVADPAFWVDYARRQSPQDLEEWAAYINERVDAVAVRGPVSEEILVRAGVEKPIEVIGDPALLFGERTLAPKRGEKILGVNIGHSRNLMWGLSDGRFLEQMEAVLWALARQGWKLVFMPVWNDDIPHTLRMADALSRRGARLEVLMTNSPREFVEATRRVDVFLGEKLHSVVLAACSYTPALMLEYRPKCFDFMKSLGLEDFCLRTDRVSVEAVGERLDRLCRESDTIRRKLFERVQSYQRKMAEQAAKVCALLE